MKIGYPCINRTLDCTSNATFRLQSYSEQKLIETIEKNITCLWRMLTFNLENNLLFFRIGSQFIPFASHPICTFDWQTHFKKEFEEIGAYLKKHHMRIGMHPDQFVLINAKDPSIVKKSVKELEYHCALLDALSLDLTTKVQIHVGGIYGDKEASTKRFIAEYKKLQESVKNRLVIENDERSYSLADCLAISKEVGIPIVFDTFHHECFNNGETFHEALTLTAARWKKHDGLPIVDYSSQHPTKRRGAHAEHIDIKHFEKFLLEAKNLDFDIMCEIKDKEKSAQKALKFMEKTRK